MSDRASDSVVVVAATALEVKAARRELPGRRIVASGVALANGHPEAATLIFCGLAGGLHAHLPTGTVVVPREVRRLDGSLLQCDAWLTDALVAGARQLGIEPVTDALLTADGLVVGDARAHWSGRGFAAADMETGLLVAPRVAAVRVILDTPQRELSHAWLQPARALRNPRNWPQAMWLARHAMPCARLAARVVRAGLAALS